MERTGMDAAEGGVAIEPTSVEHPSVEPLEPAPPGHRRRRRDGKIVKHSTLAYHVYKRARRDLKRNKTYYLSGFEDKPHYEPSMSLAWVNTRSYQASWLVKRLTAHSFINEETAENIEVVIQTVCTWIHAHPWDAANFSMGSAGTWVAILALHYLTDVISKEWAFESQDFVDRFTPEKLWIMFETAPSSERMDGVRVLPFERATAFDNDPKGTPGANFERLLDRVRNDKRCLANANAVPVLIPNVASLTRPKRIVFSQWGKQYL
jgi:hypothetical protein